MCGWVTLAMFLVLIPLVRIRGRGVPVASATGEQATEMGATGEQATEMGIDRAAPEMHITLGRAARTLEFWLLALVYLVSCGSGQVVITNMGQIAASLDYSNWTETLVCTFSIGNMLGRVVAGGSLDYLARQGDSRSLLLMLLACFLGGVGHLFCYVAAATERGAFLLPGVATIGLGFGCFYPTVIQVTAHRWGVKTLPANWTFLDGLGNGGSSWLFGTFIGTYAYSRHATDGTTCTGSGCFASTHAFMVGVCCFGVALTVVKIALYNRGLQVRLALASKVC